MRPLFKILLPLVVIGASLLAARHIIANKPEPERRAAPSSITTVEAMRLTPSDYPIRVKAHGTVRPRTESTLLPEVSGRIVEVSPDFREGGFFEQGDVLLQIDHKDYEIAVIIAEAQLAQAEMALEEEKARAQMAERDWKQMKRGDKEQALRDPQLREAARMALRMPQLAASKAGQLSAKAQLDRTHLDLERTRITAPYAGRVLEQNVGVGQHVSPGTVLARVYAIDYAEIRLPLTNRQLEYVAIPERYRGDAAVAVPSGPQVTLTARAGRREYQWQGVIIRAEGSIDTRSRQLFVIAQVDDPYGKGPAGRPPLRVGQFVEAEIEGNRLRDVFVIPRLALRESGEVLLIDSDGRLESRPVTVAWSDETHAVISQGLRANELLSLTPLSAAASGIRVAATIDGAPVPVQNLRSADATRTSSEPLAAPGQENSEGE